MTEDKGQAPWSIAIAGLTLTVQNGILMAFAVLYLPLVEEFGASRAEVATVQALVFLLGGFTGPLIGYAFDRLGPRRLFQWGALVAAIGFVAASRASSLPVVVLTYGVVAGLGLACLGSPANMMLAALWYPTARGRAIAIADLGTGLGAFMLVPVAQSLVTHFGWRNTLLVWAALLVGVLVPANVFQRLPEAITTRMRSPRGAPPVGVSAGGGESPTLRQAVRTRGFWWLVACRFFSSMGFPLMNVHMVAFAVGVGISAVQAATALGTVSLVSLAGRLLTGWLGDRLGRAETLTLTYSSAALGVGCLALLGGTGWPAWLALYVLLYGLAQGSSGIISSARAGDLFAGPAFGTIFGWIVLATGPGEAIGAWVGGAIYDLTGSYLGAFGFVVVVLGLGVFTIWRVRTG
ncbi:MAG: MFS transporter [Candidatus Methylomirabilia bacterium]